MLNCFRSIGNLVSPDTTVVQIVAFAEPDWQLTEYLSVLNRSGFEEIPSPTSVSSSDGRIWRDVPNRKWYASQRGGIHASREVVLFHRLRGSG
jgi:hypothetical protein